MIKRIITSFLIVCAFVAQSSAQERIYIWEGGSATGFNIADIDSISFTASIDITTPNPPQITLSKSKGIFITGSVVTGTISSGTDLQTAILERNGMVVLGWPITNFQYGSPIYGQSGDYIIAISGLAEGSYSLKVANKSGDEVVRYFQVRDGITSFEAVAGNTYVYDHDGVQGNITITSVSAESTGYSVVINNGTTSATISYSGNSFLNADFTTLSGVQAADQYGQNLLLYLSGSTKTINAGQLVIFSGGAIPNNAKTTTFFE